MQSTTHFSNSLYKPDMEFILYGHDGEAVLSWSRLEKRELRNDPGF
jgi:hypothetical protein